MKKFACILTLALLGSAVNGSAQVRAYGVADAGWTALNPPSGFTALASGGIRFGDWSWGLGTGLDLEGVRSVPILGEARWRAIPGKHPLELFQQGGINVVTQKSPEELISYSNGYYLRGGLAWNVLQTKGFGGLWVSAGYRYKTYRTHTELVYNTIGIDFGPNIIDESGDVNDTDAQAFLTLGWKW